MNARIFKAPLLPTKRNGSRSEKICLRVCHKVSPLGRWQSKTLSMKVDQKSI